MTKHIGFEAAAAKAAAGAGVSKERGRAIIAAAAHKASAAAVRKNPHLKRVAGVGSGPKSHTNDAAHGQSITFTKPIKNVKFNHAPASYNTNT